MAVEPLVIIIVELHRRSRQAATAKGREIGVSGVRRHGAIFLCTEGAAMQGTQSA
jgi:hypothetical protein